MVILLQKTLLTPTCAKTLGHRIFPFFHMLLIKQKIQKTLGPCKVSYEMPTKHIKLIPDDYARTCSSIKSTRWNCMSRNVNILNQKFLFANAAVSTQVKLISRTRLNLFFEKDIKSFTLNDHLLNFLHRVSPNAEYILG